jgi:hypothetical protein
VLLAVVVLMAWAAPGLVSTGAQGTSKPDLGVQSAAPTGASSDASADAAEQERCKVPDFAKAMGHEEKWKLHNNCK